MDKHASIHGRNGLTRKGYGKSHQKGKCNAVMIFCKKKKGTHLCIAFTSIYCHCAVRPFGEYHSSSAALGQQRPEITKQPLVRDWSVIFEVLCDVNRCFARNAEESSFFCIVVALRKACHMDANDHVHVWLHMNYKIVPHRHPEKCAM